MRLTWWGTVVIAPLCTILMLFMVVRTEDRRPVGEILVTDPVFLVGLLAWFVVGSALLTAGLVRVSTVEPDRPDAPSLRTLSLHRLSMVVVPAILLSVVVSVGAQLQALPLWFVAVSMTLAISIIATHMCLFLNLLVSLERRCAPADPKRLQLLMRFQALVIVAVLLGIFTAIVLFITVWRNGQTTAPPVRVLVLVVELSLLLAWSGTLSYTRTTKRLIDGEAKANSP